jgi:nucleotide-binding universal stress UspA family protein
MRIRRILVPIDFSAGSDYALKYAAVLARKFRARIIVFHALEPLILGDIYGFPGSPEIAGLNEELRRSASRRVTLLVARLRKRGLRSQGVIEHGPAAHAILEQAAKSADLVVMGTHGRSGFSRLLMGSVAEKVVRGAHHPVLTVREPGRPARRPARARSRRGAKN